MEPAEIVKAIEPLQGEVIPVRTIQETQPPEDFGMSFVLRPGLLHDVESNSDLQPMHTSPKSTLKLPQR
jgi:hypothetical protein